jgi:hypothetical protein
MITVEIKDANQISEGRAEIEIYCDLEGLADLTRQLAFLMKDESHVHLATPAWAGNELDETVNGKGNVLVHQLTIIARVQKTGSI